jgi:phosphoglucosamine mutase
MKKLFGTDGMRGAAGEFPLDAATVEIVGESLANHLREKLGRNPLIVIGRDTRESGTAIEHALRTGLIRGGADWKSAGVITTPGVAFLARTLPADAGVVISASHNPYRDNGIKIFAPSGRKLEERTEREIETDIFSQKQAGRVADRTSPGQAGGSAAEADAADLRERYIHFLTDDVGKGLSLNGMKIVLDCANGAASKIAPAVFQRLGACVTTINNKPDGRNINLECGSLHIEGLQSEVPKQEADLGVAFDGDADRALFVDPEGKLINGDGTLWVLANYFHSRHQLRGETVVATVMTNIGLEIALKSVGITLVRTDVGDKYVLEELLRLGATLGGEQSGHIIFPDISLAGDGIITSLHLLRAINDEQKPLTELTEGFDTFPQTLVNVAVKTKPPFHQVGAIKHAASKIETELGGRGRLLLRYSGTEPLARVMIEGEDQTEIEAQAAKLAGVIEKELGFSA